MAQRSFARVADGSEPAGSALRDCRGRVGVEADELVVVLDGLLVQAQRGLRVAAAEVGRGEVRIELDRPVVVADGLLVAVQLGAEAGPLQEQPGVAGVEADRLGAIGDRLLVPLDVVIGRGHGRTGRAGEAVRREHARGGLRPRRREGAGAGMAVGPRHGVRIGFRARGPEKAERSGPLSGRWQGGCRPGEQSLRGGLSGNASGATDKRGTAASQASAASRQPAKPVLATAVLWERNDQHARKDARAGTYVLRTSHTDWDLERVARTYWQLTEIEATFRSLKSEIGLRPIWHAKQDRIRAHLFIAVLAYHAVHLLRRRLGAHGCHDSWETIRCKLANWMRLTTTLVTADGERIECRQDSRPDAEAAALARAVGVPPQLHRVRTRTPLD